MELPLAAPRLFIFDYVFPLFIGPEPMKPTVVEGTAFAIGGGCFVTAAHCMREGMRAGWMALGTTDGAQVRVWNIDPWELADDHDLAVFRAEVSVPLKYFPWYTGQLAMTTTIKAAGYPYAMDSERNRLGMRSFARAVCRARERRKPGSNAFANQFPFEFSNARENAEYQPAVWRRCVNAFVQRNELNSECVDFSKRVYKLSETSCESIVAIHDHSVEFCFARERQ